MLPQLRAHVGHHTNGHKLALVGFRVLDDQVVGNTRLFQALGDGTQVLLIAGLEGDGVCSGGKGTGRAFASGMNQLSALETYREVTTHNTVVGERVVGGRGLTVKGASWSWVVPLFSQKTF